KMARSFVVDALGKSGRPTEVFANKETLRTALEALKPSPEHMFWFEYNFLYVLAADGRAEKSALGDHSPSGYRQRSRFYTISDEGRLNYARNVASYIIFLAEHTGLVPAAQCSKAMHRLSGYTTMNALLADIGHA